MAEHLVGGTRIRTEWLSKGPLTKPVVILTDDFDANSSNYFEVFEPILKNISMFCIDTMVRDGKSLEFGQPIPIAQQVKEVCEIARLEGISKPIWYGDCSRTSLACRAAKSYPNSHLILTAPFFTSSGMNHRLSLLRHILESVIKSGDIACYTSVMYLMTVGTRYLESNQFAMMATNHRHRQINLQQRALMTSHCFTKEPDPENMLECIEGRILIISGTDDPVQPVRLLEQRVSNLANCTHRLYSGGHTVFLERPAEFLADIRQFYEDVDRL